MGRCKITKCVTTFILLFIFPIMLSSSGNFNRNVVTINTPPQSVSVCVKEEIRMQLIENVSDYIAKKFDRNKSIAKAFVDYGLSNDIDICFMLAQAEIETCFGKTGIGKTKKSMFGVGGSKYSTYENCILEYCKLLKKSYLVNGKTEHHLMQNYVNRNGHRYANVKKYEAELTSKYKEICRNTRINDLQKKYK